MRRAIPLIFGAVTIVALGIAVVTFARRPIDEREVPAVALKFSCDETPTTHDFQQFWSTFRAAVQTDDKDKLYSLTARCEFVWWNWRRQGLDLRSLEFLEMLYSGRLPAAENPAVNARLVFQSKQEFLDSYHIIFSADTKRHFINGTVTQTAHDRYDIRWRDDGLSYLSFQNISGVGYKFMGNDWEP